MNKNITICLLSVFFLISCEKNKNTDPTDKTIDLRSKCHLHGCILKEDTVPVEPFFRMSGPQLYPPLPDEYFLTKENLFPFANVKVRMSSVENPETFSLIDYYTEENTDRTKMSGKNGLAVENPVITKKDLQIDELEMPKDDMPQKAKVLFCPMCRKERNKFLDYLHKKHPDSNYIRFKTKENK